MLLEITVLFLFLAAVTALVGAAKVTSLQWTTAKWLTAVYIALAATALLLYLFGVKI
jgi:hypothetical protein